jgi:hypothetical protein
MVIVRVGTLQSEETVLTPSYRIPRLGWLFGISLAIVSGAYLFCRLDRQIFGSLLYAAGFIAGLFWVLYLNEDLRALRFTPYFTRVPLHVVLGGLLFLALLFGGLMPLSDPGTKAAARGLAWTFVMVSVAGGVLCGLWRVIRDTEPDKPRWDPRNVPRGS